MNCRPWETGISKDNWPWEKKIQGKRVLGENKLEQTVWHSQDSGIPEIPGFPGFPRFIGSRERIMRFFRFLGGIPGFLQFAGSLDCTDFRIWTFPEFPAPGRKNFNRQSTLRERNLEGKYALDKKSKMADSCHCEKRIYMISRHQRK